MQMFVAMLTDDNFWLTVFIFYLIPAVDNLVHFTYKFSKVISRKTNTRNVQTFKSRILLTINILTNLPI